MDVSLWLWLWLRQRVLFDAVIAAWGRRALIVKRGFGDRRLPFRGHRMARRAVPPRRARDALVDPPIAAVASRIASARQRGRRAPWREILGAGPPHLCPLRRAYAARRCNRPPVPAKLANCARSRIGGWPERRLPARFADRQGRSKRWLPRDAGFGWRRPARDDRGGPRSRACADRRGALAAPAGDWEQALRHGEGLVAERDGKVVGTGLRWRWGPRHATLGLIIVSPACQGRRIGHRLMTRCSKGSTTAACCCTPPRRTRPVRAARLRAHRRTAPAPGQGPAVAARRAGRRLAVASGRRGRPRRAARARCSARGMPRPELIADLFGGAEATVVLDHEDRACGFAHAAPLRPRPRDRAGRRRRRDGARR